MIELSPIHYIILVLGGFAAGFIDSIAGGGGIVTVPILLGVGIPPHFALGTNKLQASFGSLTSMLRYRHSGLFSFRKIWRGILFTFFGAVTGTILIQLISADILGWIIPFFLAALFVYTLLTPQLGSESKQGKIKEGLFFCLFGLILGFYDGFFGPGTGSFWAIAIVGLIGWNLKSATATTKAMNFTSNIVSLIVFIIGGKVLLLPGLLMGAAQIGGAWTGSHLVINKGTKLIRIFLLIAVGATILNLFRKQFF